MAIAAGLRTHMEDRDLLGAGGRGIDDVFRAHRGEACCPARHTARGRVVLFSLVKVHLMGLAALLFAAAYLVVYIINIVESVLI